MSNEYAETGSLIHVGIEALHKLNSVDAALAIMAIKQPDFPEANAAKAAAGFRYYREQQEQWGAVTRTEFAIAFTLDPAPFDPTQAPIELTGTLDQVRNPSHNLDVVCDVKTGSKPAEWMINHYCSQLCGYQYGYYKATGIKPQAAIIRTQGALNGGGKIWHPCPWGWDTVIDVLDSVRVLVALYRMGLKIANSGDHCRYCPAGGIEYCSIGESKPEKGRYALPVATNIEDLFK